MKFSSTLQKLTRETSEGLPNNKVLLYPLALLLVFFFILVTLGVTGSSTGMFHKAFSDTSDTRLIFGEPQSIRSDEWNVQTTWTISQVEQGLPPVNGTFPGGMDATVQHDLPTTDWSTGFRPHLFGFFFLPLDQAMAWKWWLPGFSLIAATYLFAITMMPKRPVTSAFLAIGFFFSPFFQWWYLSITFYPPAWAFLLMASGIWLLKTKRKLPRVVLPVIVAYLTVTVGMGIYVPFIVPSVVVAAAFLVGFTLTKDSSFAIGVAERLKRLSSLFIAGFVGAIILGLWIVTRIPTIQNFLGTVYPGQRIQLVGQATTVDILGLAGGVFGYGAGREGNSVLGVNASEASTFLLPGLFLFFTVVFFFIRKWRDSHEIDGVAISITFLLALGVAYFLIPNWDFVSQLLLLDRTTLTRFRLEFGLLSMVMIIYVLRNFEFRFSDLTKSKKILLSFTGGFLALVFYLVFAVALMLKDSPVATIWLIWIVVLILFVATVFFVGLLQPIYPALAFLCMSVLLGANVNPIYSGVYDLNDTRISEEIKLLPNSETSNWVGIGLYSSAVLVQSGLPGYSGFQSAPSRQMWNEIDPSGSQAQNWNRLAFVGWFPGEGEPLATNPYGDQISLNFDSCSLFSQKYVSYILSETPVNQECINEVSVTKEGKLSFYVYEVTK